MIIYLIRNRITGKSYVGQTTRPLEKRWQEHLHSHEQFRIARAIRKYGKEHFEISILAETDNLEELNRLEIEYISKRKTLSPDGYNLSVGGGQCLFAEETRTKMSVSRIGNRNALGFKHSAETRAKERRGNRHVSPSPETRRKMSLSMMGNAYGKSPKFSIERRMHISDALKGKKHSAERRARESAGQRRRRAREGNIQCNQ